MSSRTAFDATDRGYVVALAAALVLSTTAILIRHLTVTFGLPPLVLAFWRNAFVVATLLPALALLAPGRLRMSRSDLPFLAAYGLVLAAFNGLWTVSVARIGASLATVLVYTSGAATALLGAAFLDERLGRAKGAAVVLCVAGAALVASPGGESRADVAGLVAGLLSGLAYAVYSLMGRAAARRGLDAWSTVLHVFAFGALFLLCGLVAGPVLFPGAPAGGRDLLWLGGSAAGWGELLLLAAGPTVVGFGLYGVSLALLPASVANLVLTLEPVLTALIAWAWLGERLSAAEAVGGALVVLGVVALRVGERREPAASVRTPREAPPVIGPAEAPGARAARVRRGAASTPASVGVPGVGAPPCPRAPSRDRARSAEAHRTARSGSLTHPGGGRRPHPKRAPCGVMPPLGRGTFALRGPA